MPGAVGGTVALGKTTDPGDLLLILGAASGEPLLLSQSRFVHQYRRITHNSFQNYFRSSTALLIVFEIEFETPLLRSYLGK